MKHFLNIGNCLFNLMLLGTAQTLIGKMVHCDDTGVTILSAVDGNYYSYAPGVVQNIQLAP